MQKKSNFSFSFYEKKKKVEREHAKEIKLFFSFYY